MSILKEQYNHQALLLELASEGDGFDEHQKETIKKIVDFLRNAEEEALTHDEGDFVIPAKDGKPKARIYVLHGVLSSAKEMITGEFSNYIIDNPDFEYHFLNATERKELCDVLPDDMADMYTQGDYGFVWDENSVCVIKKKLSRHSDDVPNVLFGFSQGGFVVSQIADKLPEKISYSFLHSSGLITRGKEGESISKEKKELLKKRKIETLIARDDHFLKTPWVIAMLPLHYWKSFRLRMKGVKTKTIISNGFGHGINHKSLDIFDKRMRRALKL